MLNVGGSRAEEELFIRVTHDMPAHAVIIDHIAFNHERTTSSFGLNLGPQAFQMMKVFMFDLCLLLLTWLWCFNSRSLKVR